MFSSKRELVKRALEIAKTEHPGGFNKQKLIDASKKVYGGFGETQVAGSFTTKPIKTMEDVNNMGNAMAQIDGHYPVGMSGCYVVGLNGGCGLDCPVYLDAECGNPGEMSDGGNNLSEEEVRLHIEMYGEI